MSEADFQKLREVISNEKKILREMVGLLEKRIVDAGSKQLALTQMKALKKSFKKNKNELISSLDKINMAKILNKVESKPAETKKDDPKNPENIKHQIKYSHSKPTGIEKTTLDRLKKVEKKEVKRGLKKPSSYVVFANNLFANLSLSLLRQGKFRKLKRNLVRANLPFIPKSYVSVIFFTTLMSMFIAILAFVFFLFFNIGPALPFVSSVEENIGPRLLKTFWILFVIPIVTFIAMYVYPALEKRSLESKINQELPFATIHMSSISGSMIDPSKIFSIMITTKEYPTLEKQFVRLLNELNILGYDLVTALRNSAFDSPSRKLSDLFNGLATTITSGGSLPEFFEKRSQSLLFDYRIEREKYTKNVETFMDIYISVVIAAPMILMLLLMMMKISGFGIALSTSMITLVMILGVTVVNIFFLTFLQLRQPSG